MKNENVKFFHLDEYNQSYHREKKKKNFKHKLLAIRKYFVEHNTIYILVKILIGLILFGLPIFIFKKIINKNNSSDVETSNYKSASIPLIMAIVIFIIYVLGLIAIKCFQLCKNRL
jgi:predicted permease